MVHVAGLLLEKYIEVIIIIILLLLHFTDTQPAPHSDLPSHAPPGIMGKSTTEEKRKFEALYEELKGLETKRTCHQ